MRRLRRVITNNFWKEAVQDRSLRHSIMSSSRHLPTDNEDYDGILLPQKCEEEMLRLHQIVVHVTSFQFRK